ncbi:hypothetical protein QBC47DRAFT_438269 [Echria macrotheca]|uniref:FAD-binding PCMH-type domain-containing protein n=1 Tax=Echria macrotheca TaxID=438768 RepID=A0AAJ0FE28_9PEZI|nr:hypothetical protein QBC47DRAFT_438269 [Echria macrotheca]
MTSNTTAAIGTACCLALAAILPAGIISLPETVGYNASQQSYFLAQQREVSPACVVSPTTTDQVATIIKTIASSSSRGDCQKGSQARCPFVIRSGGHSAVPGTVNSAGGVTLDLRAFNSIQLSEDKSTVSIGVGARWGPVYRALEEHGLSVAGSRAAQVGVGGFVLGGGISYFSPRYGWSCDSLVGAEIVLADGSIVYVTDESDGELMAALRGGSGNFGVVTRVDMKTFAQPPFWGGTTVRDLSTADGHLQFLDRFVRADDEHASLIMSFATAAGYGSVLFVGTIYTKEGVENPPVFAELDALPALQPNSGRIAPMSSHADEMGSTNPDGLRQVWKVTIFKSTLPMINATYLHWKSMTDRMEAIPSLVTGGLSLHPLPPHFYNSPRSNRNSLGFEGKEGPYVMVLSTIAWTDSAADEEAQEVVDALIGGVEDEAKKRGLYDPFVYLNYAGRSQDPLAGYGPDSLARLRRVKARVDPHGLFSDPASGFKLPREV